MTEDVEARANTQDLRANSTVYYIARCLQNGDINEANSVYQSDRDAFMSITSKLRLGGCGAVLTRLQAFGLIEDFDQETLNPVTEEELAEIIDKLGNRLTDDKKIDIERQLELREMEMNRVRG